MIEKATKEPRVCYYVESAGTKWMVRFDHSGDETQVFDDQDSALDAARAAAAARWEIFGLASCVKVRGLDGLQYLDEAYG